MAPIVIEHVDWAVLWDAEAGRHVYRRDVDIAFDNGAIVFVGERYEGEAAARHSGRGRLLMPGFVDIHTHPTSEPLRRGLTDEILSPGFHHSSLYEYLPVITTTPEGAAAAMRIAVAELLKSGVTTVVDLSVPFEGWLDILGESGIRACAAPMYRDARWFTSNGHALEYEWDSAAGGRAMAAAHRLIERARQHPSGRLSAMVAPAQIDTCTADLLVESHAFARERNLPFQIHVSQSVAEFHEMFRRTGMTPIAWMDSLGILDERTILGHAIFLDHHPWLHWTSRRDLGLIAERGASVAHCPTVFVRRGIALRSFGDYERAGVNVGIGTDTYPHDMVAELRTASYTARTIAETVADHTAADIFTAATVGGARALRREDIGRIAPGAKADFVLVDLTDPAMRPIYDPVRTLLYSADSRVVRDVWVDGERVVADGRVTTIDLDAATAALEEAQREAIAGVRGRDWAGRRIEELCPRAFPFG
ncbi:amidohydrolase family protein [Acuticoccus mangrovi]|uniref:Amidohydrolase family protein n=1 Tax=Acuticoccus mangrovi TaxID=2796142 RepID=A0A934MG60_9HYPH|nr:amidohydrolase family protein [Acuticoccus mangrovi]MBJ3774611.1 amidohydrolase family protein [Acuticoccus mangrovi]